MYYEYHRPLKTVQRTVRTFAILLLPIIRQINKFVGETSVQGDGAPLGFCVKNSEWRPVFNGVFTGNGLVGMPEAAYTKKLEIVLPFIGAVLDRICCES